MYGTISHRMSTQDSADAKIICYSNLLQHAAQIELLCVGMLHPSTYDDAVCVNRHHSNDLVPLPVGTLPDDDAVLRNVA